MKALAALFLGLFVAGSVHAQTSLKKDEAADVLIATYKATKNAKTKQILGDVLTGQGAQPTVILESKCNYVGRSMIQNCTFIIGVQGEEEGGGFGVETTYFLKVRSIQGTPTSIKLELQAG